MYTLAIVDDEVELREGLAYHFPWEKHGFSVSGVFAGARELLAFLETTSVDVLITDIRMPRMSGLDLILKIKEELNRDIIFCLLSAYRDFEYAQEGIHLGVRYYLLKPTDFDEIAEAFEKIRAELDACHPLNKELKDIDNVLVRKAMTIMDHQMDSCTLLSIASQLGLNPSYLSRLFREESGEKFQDYLQRIKMERAATLLGRSHQYRTKEIAAMLGYQDTQNFCRRFKLFYGMSPGSYRRKEAEN